MIAGASGEVWRLPSGMRFLESAAETVATGGALTLLLEDWVDRNEFVDELRSHLAVRGLAMQAVRDAEPKASSPLTCLVDGLGLPETRLRYDVGDDAVTRLLQLDELPDATAVIASQDEGLGSDSWINFTQVWSACSKRLSDGGAIPRALCVLLPASAVCDRDLPTDAQLAAAWMMGIPDHLEMRIVCRLLDEDESPAAGRWREHVLPALCGTDLDLLSSLWSAVLEEPEAVLAALDEYAKKRRWGAEELRTLGVDAFARMQSDVAHDDDGAPPSPRLRRAWSSGALTVTAEHGPEVNSAALPLLGAQDVLMQRVWRGQVALVLPAMDGVRMAMCSQLTRSLGPRWATEFSLPPIEDEARALQESPLACQWGHMLYLLRHHGRLANYAEWIPLVRLARKLRNRLAHGSPVSFSRYAAFVDAARACGFGQWL